MEVPEAWRMMERLFRYWVSRKGDVWTFRSPLETAVAVSLCELQI